MRCVCGLVGFAILAVSGIAGAASAATLSEADVSGGFSSDWSKPSVIATDVNSVSGITGQNVYDIFQFTLPTGANSVTLTFSAGKRMQDSYSAGSTVKFSSSAFRWGWDGQDVGSAQIAIWSKDDKSLTLKLDEAFGPTLFLALYNTHGEMDYNISGVGFASIVDKTIPAPEAVPAPVPLPAAGLMLGAGLVLGAAGGLVRRKRHRS